VETQASLLSQPCSSAALLLIGSQLDILQTHVVILARLTTSNCSTTACASSTDIFSFSTSSSNAVQGSMTLVAHAQRSGQLLQAVWQPHCSANADLSAPQPD
jgi:hypothetical protein